MQIVAFSCHDWTNWNRAKQFSCKTLCKNLTKMPSIKWINTVSAQPVKNHIFSIAKSFSGYDLQFGIIKILIIFTRKESLNISPEFIVKFSFSEKANYLQSSSWFWRLLSRCQSHEEDCANFCDLLRKANLYTNTSLTTDSYQNYQKSRQKLGHLPRNWAKWAELTVLFSW